MVQRVCMEEKGERLLMEAYRIFWAQLAAPVVDALSWQYGDFPVGAAGSDRLFASDVLPAELPGCT